MEPAIVARQTSWTSIILLCGKCARKMDGGYGPARKDTLRSALRTELKARGQRGQVRLVETKCMGICPRKAVMVVGGDRPDKLLTVPKGARADEVLALAIVRPGC